MGCVTQIGEQGWNIGRMVPMVAGWPETVCGTTVDRQCGSSLQTNFNAAAAIWAGQLEVVVSAGVEMMSRVPMGSNGSDLSDKLHERWQIVPQGSPPRRSRPSGISRATRSTPTRSSRTGARSPRSMTASSSRRSSRSRSRPPGPPSSSRSTRRRGATRPPRSSRRSNPPSCRTASSPPATRARSSTARPPCWSRASGRPRGSAWSRAPASSRSGSRASTRTGCCTGTRRPAGRRSKAGLTWDDISVVEVNEAFASVVLQFAHDAGLEDRFADINPNGGGISLGHPLGATGARVTATLLNELERARRAAGSPACASASARRSRP